MQFRHQIHFNGIGIVKPVSNLWVMPGLDCLDDISLHHQGLQLVCLLPHQELVKPRLCLLNGLFPFSLVPWQAEV